MPFGSAFPDATLFAQPETGARALSSVARKFTPHSSLANLPPGNDALRQHIATLCAERRAGHAGQKSSSPPGA